MDLRISHQSIIVKYDLYNIEEIPSCKRVRGQHLRIRKDSLIYTSNDQPLWDGSTIRLETAGTA
jgi:hypothetical protein